jgi:hypothetical protein
VISVSINLTKLRLKPPTKMAAAARVVFARLQPTGFSLIYTDKYSSLVGATRHLPTDTFSGIEPMSKDALAGPDGSPLPIIN